MSASNSRGGAASSPFLSHQPRAPLAQCPNITCSQCMSSFTLSSAEISAANATGVPASLSVESSHLSVAFCCGSVFCAVCAKNATKCPGCDASVEEVMGIMGTGCWVSVSRVDDVLAIAPLDISTPSNFPFPHYLQRIARSLLISPMHIVDEIEDALLAFPLVLSAGMKVAVDALDDVRKSALREEVENAVRKIHEFRKLFLPKKSRKKRKKKNNGNSSSGGSGGEDDGDCGGNNSGDGEGGDGLFTMTVSVEERNVILALRQQKSGAS